MITMKAQLAGNKAFAQIEQVRKEWRKGMDAEAQAIKKEYQKTTSTWKHQVSFVTKVRPTTNGITAEVHSSGANSRIYWFVHEGISVMHAVLSPDWSPKTQPRILGSGSGSGKLITVNPKYEGPLYEAREFTDTIIEVRKKPFEQRMRKATRVGARAATQGG